MKFGARSTMYMTSRDKEYRTIAAITAEIAKKLDKVDKGTCSLSEMDHLLDDLRELEERIIIIRYKGMERMRYPEPSQNDTKSRVAEPYRAPELPLEMEPEGSVAEEDQTEEFAPIEEIEEEIPPNQISLIDSIEEISQEASINERMQGKHKRSVAQQLQSKPVDSVLKALNLNQKMGLVNQVFSGDEAQFKSLMREIDSATDLESAQAIVNRMISAEQREEISIVRTLDSLIERRFA